MRLIKYTSSSFIVACFVLSLVSFVQAQQGLPYNNNIMATLDNPNMIAELELVGEQKRFVGSMQNEFTKVRERLDHEMKFVMEGMDKEDRENVRRDYRSRANVERIKIVDEIKAMLLPHQVERLEQLTAQRKLREAESQSNDGLLSPEMKSYLKIGDSQEDRIRKKSEAIRNRVQEQVRNIMEKARAELLDELTREQREKYQVLVGDPLANHNLKKEPGKPEPKKNR